MASPRIDNNPLASARINATGAVARQGSGSLNGEQVVQAKSDASILEDAREELSVAIAVHKGESKTFRQRQVAAGGGVRRMQIEQVQAYLDATRRHPDPAELANLAKRIQDAARPRDVAQQSSQSPAHWFALLQFALHDAQRRGLPDDVVERLRDALEDLDLEYGSEIQAGLNTAQVASEFAPDSKGVETFQRTYTDIVLGEQTFAQTLQLVLKRLGGVQGQDFERALKALLGALGAELTAARASTQPERLQALVQDVYRLQVAGTALEECTAIAKEVAQRFGILTVNPAELMKDLVTYTSDRWVMPGRLMELAQKFMVAGLPERLAFHRGTREALRKLPVWVFLGLDERDSLLKVAQQVYDETVAAEEERLGLL